MRFTLFCYQISFCLQETMAPFSIPNYKCYNSNRPDSQSGGVCIGIHRSFEKWVTEVKVDSDNIIAVRIKGMMKSPCKNLLIINVYDSPPNSSFKKCKGSYETLEDVLEFLTTLNDEDEPLIFGDFNARTSVFNHECKPEENNWANYCLISNLSGLETASRVSEDDTLNTRGRKLLDTMAYCNLTILNGNALGDRVSDSNSSLSDSYTSMKDDLSIINVYLQEQFRRQRHYQLK